MKEKKLLSRLAKLESKRKRRARLDKVRSRIISEKQQLKILRARRKVDITPYVKKAGRVVEIIDVIGFGGRKYTKRLQKGVNKALR